MQHEGGGWGSAFVDDGAHVRRVASEVVSAALGVQVTSTSVRSAWLSLHTAYQAPEAEMLVRAMNDPRRRAAAHLSRVRALRDVLWAYADRLDVLAATWVEYADTGNFVAQRDAVDVACADAIAALIGPVGLSSRPSAPDTLSGDRDSGWASGDRVTEGRVANGDSPTTWQFDPLGTILGGWLGFRPPEEDDVISRALYGYGLLTFAGSTTTTWVLGVDYSATAQPFPRDLKTTQALRRWSSTGKVLDRVGVGLTFATATWSEWQRSASYESEQRVGRSLAVGATTTAGAWAGGQAGAWAGGAIGTALFPGAGTVVGAALGGVVGGFAGSEAGGWVGDQVVDVGGQAGDLVGDGLDWARDAVGDTLDTVTFWD